MGILWKYTENPSIEYQKQAISIIPLKSGYRNKETQKIVWNTFYLKHEKSSEENKKELKMPVSDISKMELVLPRHTIINFSLFDFKADSFFKSGGKSDSSNNFE